MDIITAQKHRLQQLVITGQVRKYDLARKANLRASVLTGMEDAAWNPLTHTLAELVKAADEMGFTKRPRRAVGNELAA